MNRSTLYCPQVRPDSTARLRLFCFPFAGGRATTYRSWAAQLPAAVEVIPVEMPGRGYRTAEKPFTRLETAVADLSQALRPFLDRPFAFFGHSMGALLSFELACRLWGEWGLAPAQLFISAHRSPELADTEPPTYSLPDDQFIAKLRKLNGTPKEVLEHPELLAYLIPFLRADFELCNTYTYHPGLTLTCPIWTFGGLQDPSVGVKELQGWEHQTTGQFNLQMLPGDHFFINTGQSLLLRLLTERLVELLKPLPAAPAHSVLSVRY